MSQVEDALRAQRDVWREVAERVAGNSRQDFPPEAPKRILLFGIGSSHFSARLTGFSLIRAKGKARAPVVACSSLDIGHEVKPGRGDWAFGFSHRGKTPGTLKALE